MFDQRLNRYATRVLAVTALLAALACGGTGPKGDKGEPGATGPAGTNGTNGANGTDGTNATKTPLRLLDVREEHWVQRTRDRLNALMADKGFASATYDAAKRPVAVFDWDNTMMKNDIGDATFFYLLNNDLVLMPAGGDFSLTSAHLTAAAVAALHDNCGALAAPGAPIPTSTNAACADQLFSIYDSGVTVAYGAVASAAAWDSELTVVQNRPYAWVGQLTAGYTPEEVREIAWRAYRQNSDAPVGSTQTVGSNSVTGYVRIYTQMHDLIGTLQDNGFDVWIVSASPQYFVEPVAREVGVAEDHVIGIRQTFDAAGKLTSSLQGCALAADGDPEAPIPFMDGKRCWINKVIFNQAPDQQLVKNPDAAQRPALSAGDSDTDITFVKDAYLKLVINRNKTQLMCNAYKNVGDSWLVNPMFLSPKACKSSAYACSTAVDPNGNPIVDENGDPIADQADAVCTLP